MRPVGSGFPRVIGAAALGALLALGCARDSSKSVNSPPTSMSAVPLSGEGVDAARPDCPSAAAEPREAGLRLNRSEASIEEWLEARVLLDLPDRCRHEVQVVWKRNDGHVMYRSTFGLDAAFGRQEFVAHFWKEGGMRGSVGLAGPLQGTAVLVVDGRECARESFLML